LVNGDATCEFPGHILTVRGMVVSAFKALKVAEFITPFADDENWMAYSTAVDGQMEKIQQVFPCVYVFFWVDIPDNKGCYDNILMIHNFIS